MFVNLFISWCTFRRGLTLVELLVVICVIGLLLCILMPSLGRAKALSYQLVCQNQLKQWGLAFEMYAVGNNDYYPHIDGRDRTDELGKNPGPEEYADYYHGWVDVLPPLIGEKSWRDYGKYEHPDRGTIYQCPSAKLAPRKFYDLDREKYGYFSYAMNSCLELDRKCWKPYGWPKGDRSWQMPSFLKTTLIKDPSRVYLVFDQLLDPRKGYDAKRINRSAGKYCGSYPKAFSARHTKGNGQLGGSIVFCDYHVEWKASVWKKDWPEDLEVPPRDDPDWYPYP